MRTQRRGEPHPAPRDAPVLRVGPCAACAAGTGSQRLRWKTSRLLPSCLAFPSKSSPGTSAASPEPRPVFRAHIFLLHIALGVTLHPAGGCRRGARISLVPALHPKAAWRGDGAEGGGCGWPDRFEFSFLALLISCHANPDTGKSLDHAERLRVCVCGCALGEGANRQRFTRENRRTRWHGEAGGWWGPRWVGRFGCPPLCSCCGCPQNTPVSPRGATHTPARMCPCVGKEMPCLGWAWQGGKAGVLPPDAPPTPTPCPGIL